MDNDDFNFIDKNVSTVIDLLESKKISWAFYQEDMPYSGFEGFAWVNQKTGANDYVRKHNPGSRLISFCVKGISSPDFCRSNLQCQHHA